MIYYILTDINSKHPLVYCDMQGFAREFNTYVQASEFISQWKMENSVVVARCSHDRNYLV